MGPAFVIGNGVSRNAVVLEKLRQRGTIYGCNAMYRDFAPDGLISTDQPISEEIQRSGYSARHKHYTRRPLPGFGALDVPQKYFGYSSGPIAVSIACIHGYTTIYLLGFDMGPTTQGKFNNVYADTEFYKKSSATPTFSGNWARQISAIAGDFPKISFVRIRGETTADVAEINKIKNLIHMPMAEFLDRINNAKDL